MKFSPHKKRETKRFTGSSRIDRKIHKLEQQKKLGLIGLKYYIIMKKKLNEEERELRKK